MYFLTLFIFHFTSLESGVKHQSYSPLTVTPGIYCDVVFMTTDVVEIVETCEFIFLLD